MRLPMVGLGILGSVAACGSSFNADHYPTPQDLLAASMARYQAGDCGAAVVGLRRVTVELPARDARLADVRFYLAECLERDGNHLEASREFRRVADEFPTHERAPWGLLRAGESLAELWKRPELDPTYGQSALSMFSELLGRYPQSEAAAAARERIAELQDRLALKALKNGDFYHRLHAYDSAIIYYRRVIAEYADSRYAPVAVLKLIGTYRRIGYEEEAREMCEYLRRFFPDADGIDERCPAPSAPS